MKKRNAALSITVCVLVIEFTGCKHVEEATNRFPSTISTAEVEMDTTTLIPVETFSSDYFPCSDCHSERTPNPKRRKLVDMHEDIVFDHDSANRWCLACHNLNDRDYLRLADGRLLPFDESYKLCGQCHGPKYRDWKLGIHGRRTGQWDGKKQYLLCVHCHNPHSPRFKSLKPLPPPERPEQIKIDSTYEEKGKTPATP